MLQPLALPCPCAASSELIPGWEQQQLPARADPSPDAEGLLSPRIEAEGARSGEGARAADQRQVPAQKDK